MTDDIFLRITMHNNYLQCKRYHPEDTDVLGDETGSKSCWTSKGINLMNSVPRLRQYNHPVANRPGFKTPNRIIRGFLFFIKQ